MTVLKNIFGAAILIVSFSNLLGVAHGATISEKAAMQAAMQQFIDRSLVKGAYLQIDMKDGKVRHLYPNKAHPMILGMGEYFVLCSDFRDASSGSVNVDFYLARENDLFVVFHVAVDDRVMLQRQISEGRAQRVD